MQVVKSLDKIIAIAGGCLVFASGAGGIAAGAGMAASAASLLNAWLDSKAKHGPESDRVLERTRNKVRDELAAGRLSEADQALLARADHSLDKVLLDCIPEPRRLAAAFGSAEGFTRAAAALVVGEVAARDNLFAESGARAQPLARRFAIVVAEAAFEAALISRDYFAKLMPFVLEDMSRGIHAIREEQTYQGDAINRIEETSLRNQELLEVFLATSTGQRARHQMADLRPFIVLARKIDQEVDDPDRALTELDAMVELVLRQKENAERGSNLDQIVDDALRRIAEKAQRGEFDSAAKEAESAFTNWSRREVERQQAARQEGIRLIEANIGQNMFRRDPEAVAVWIERKLAQERDSHSVDAYALLEAAAEWQDRGTVKGLNLDLAIAAAVARRALPLCQSSDQRFTALNRLGTALHELGDRQSGTAQLHEAVAVFRSALQHLVGEDSSPEWAMIHNNLGGALVSLGSREKGTARLLEAVDAYKAALGGLSREQMPQSWARTQSNLGCALVGLGERTGGETALADAVTAFREALKERTPEKNPLDWADTQGNLGGALLRMWEEGRDIRQLLDAASAFFAVGEVLVREEVPLRWADNEQNLGTALLRLGEIDPAGPYLELAEEAFQGALGEWTRERAPIQYAANALSLAHAITLIAAGTRSVIRLDEAEALARDAQTIVVQAEHEPYVDLADQILASIGMVRRALAGAPDPA